MNRLKELRKANKMNQTELAEKLGVHQRTVSRYEKEEIILPADMLQKICVLFGCSSDYLLGISDINAKSPAVIGGAEDMQDEFMRLQAANSLYLRLNTAGRAQATAYLEFLVAQQEKQSGLQGSD